MTDHAKGAKGKKHIAIVDKRKSFFKPKLKPFTEESTESTGETIFSNEQSQKTLEMHFHNVVCINSEIIWTLKSALGLFSVRANEHSQQCFQTAKLHEILVWKESCMPSTMA